MATAISSGSGVNWCCISIAVPEVYRWSGLVDNAPEHS